MKNKFITVFICVLTAVPFISRDGYCAEEGKIMKESAYNKVMLETEEKNGVKEITYEQFMGIWNSGEPYILLDVLPLDSYNEGHIPGALSFPVDTINEENASAKLKKDSNIIVYCGSFKCTASTTAAKKLKDLGYQVLDYKGGLKEWYENGNKLTGSN